MLNKSCDGFTFFELLVSLLIVSTVLLASHQLRENDVKQMQLCKNLNSISDSLSELSIYYRGSDTVDNSVFVKWQKQLKGTLSTINANIERKGHEVFIIWQSAFSYWHCYLPQQVGKACYAFYFP